MNKAQRDEFGNRIPVAKRKGLNANELAERRRDELEGRTRSHNDVRPKGAPRVMGQRASLRRRGQVRSSAISDAIIAFRAVSESRSTATAPTMMPPVSVRSSKPHYRKAMKRYVKRAQAQREAAGNGNS